MGQAEQMRSEALARARGSQATSNLPTIFQEFMDRGIPEEDIKPRENIFTFHAWKALGRSVKKGEHGVRILTWVPTGRQVQDDGSVVFLGGKRPKTAVVFHISQTEVRG